MSATNIDDRVATVLEAAGIAVERCGQERIQRLSDAERELYHWVLAEFADHAQPGGDAFRARARELGLDPAAATAALAREDLVHFDEAGEVAVAYPFSGRATGHRVRLGDGHEVWAMCALDALGMAAMLDREVEVHSADPSTGAQITARVDRAGRVEWQPDEAVVIAGSRFSGPSYQGCCGVLNFFVSRTNAERYLAEQPELRGRVISLPEAAAAGAAIFGQALRP